MLTVDRVSRRFGGVYANQDVTLEVGAGELRGVIGPNGAGKSTLFNLIAGHLRAESGTITMAGQRIDRMPPHLRARHGVAIVFQGARLFPGMSVLENVMVGAHARTRAGLVAAALRPPSQRREERQTRAYAEAKDSLSASSVACSWLEPSLGDHGCSSSTSPHRDCGPRSGRS